MAEVKVVVTSKESGERLAEKERLFLDNGVQSAEANLALDPETTYQTVIGFGPLWPAKQRALGNEPLLRRMSMNTR